MKKKDILDFLNFRQKFTFLEWFELNEAISEREKEKAAKLKLDDFDVSLIVNKLESFPFIDVEN